MLKHLKMSSLACKCVFYRPENNAKGDPVDLNFEGFEMQIHQLIELKKRMNKMGSFVELSYLSYGH